MLRKAEASTMRASLRSLSAATSLLTAASASPVASSATAAVTASAVVSGASRRAASSALLARARMQQQLKQNPDIARLLARALTTTATSATATAASKINSINASAAAAAALNAATAGAAVPRAALSAAPAAPSAAAASRPFVTLSVTETVPARPVPGSLPFPRLVLSSSSSSAARRGRAATGAAPPEPPAHTALRAMFRAQAVRMVATLAARRPVEHTYRTPKPAFAANGAATRGMSSAAAAAAVAVAPQEAPAKQGQNNGESSSNAKPDPESGANGNRNGSKSEGEGKEQWQQRSKESEHGETHGRFVPPPHGRFRWGMFWVANGIIGTFLAMSIADIIWDFGFMNPGVHRSMYFWAHALPIWLAYRAVQVYFNQQEALTDWVRAHATSHAALVLQPLCLPAGVTRDEAADEVYAKLNRAFATTIMDVILRLRGYYVKLGQLGSMQPEMLPEQWVEVLSTLQDKAPAEPFDRIRAVIEAELGRPLEEVFMSFETVPVGAASIAQVHRAMLKDGREVAVKVQFPDVQEVFTADMSAVRMFVKHAQPEHLVFLDEIERQFVTEFDFEREAAFLSLFRQALGKSPFSRKVVVPEPVAELTTRNVLTMEYLHGDKLVTALKKLHTRIAGDQGITLQELMERNKAAAALTNTQVRLYSTLFYLNDAVNNAARFAFNWTAGWFVPPVGYKRTTPPIAIPAMMDLLLDVHAFQMFDVGAINGDPHPGNIMLLDDDRMGLIDFGQVKALGMLERAVIARLFDALDRGDKKETVRWYKAMGHRSEHNDEQVLFELAQLGYDYDNATTRGGKNIQLYFEELTERDKLVMGNDTWVIPSRMLILLRGLAAALKYEVRASPAFARAGRRFLDENPVWKLASDCALEYSESDDAVLETAKYWKDLDEYIADRVINDARFKPFGLAVTRGDSLLGADVGSEDDAKGKNKGGDEDGDKDKKDKKEKK